MNRDWIAEYLAHTMHLTTEQHGAYVLLLLSAWHSSATIPKSDQRLASIARLPQARWLEIKDDVLCFFESADNEVYVHPRLKSALIAKDQRAERAKKNGGKGGRPKAKKNPEETQTITQKKPRRNPDHNPEETQKKPSGFLSVENQQVNKSEKKPIKGEVDQIFQYWISIMGKNSQAKLTAQRKRLIEARLKDGYTVDMIKQAIDGCAKSPYHMGQNDAGTVYDDLTLICRSGDKLEFFAKNVAKINPVARTRAETIDQTKSRLDEQINRTMQYIQD